MLWSAYKTLRVCKASTFVFKTHWFSPKSLHLFAVLPGHWPLHYHLLGSLYHRRISGAWSLLPAKVYYAAGRKEGTRMLKYTPLSLPFPATSDLLLQVISKKNRHFWPCFYSKLLRIVSLFWSILGVIVQLYSELINDNSEWVVKMGFCQLNKQLRENIFTCFPLLAAVLHSTCFYLLSDCYISKEWSFCPWINHCYMHHCVVCCFVVAEWWDKNWNK